MRIIEECLGMNSMSMTAYKIMGLLVPKIIQNSFHEHIVRKSEYGQTKKLRELAKTIKLQ